MGSIFFKTLLPKEVDVSEVRRYAGNGKNVLDKNFDDKIEECIVELGSKTLQKVGYCFSPITIDGENVEFDFATIKSKTLSNHLKGCRQAVVFAATIGIEIDRLINKYSKVSITKALIFQALGTERIESLCDEFCFELAKDVSPKKLLSRFSPGYGDLPLSFQNDVFARLDCSRKLGICLNESLLMSPSKSVTAIVGISNDDVQRLTKCENCDNDCNFRRINENS